ncbi:MAG: hypothetical protein K2P84_06005 [Undibacterium sp.]|nr:hypothetical protein [Undibacterium sp.]
MKKYCLLVLLMSIVHMAIACKPAPIAYDLNAFRENDNPSRVLFRAKVISTHETQESDAVIRQDIYFRASSWWYGAEMKEIVAVGYIGTMKGTSCAGVFDFSVKKGQEWLIIGSIENGIVVPANMLSILLIDGKIPATVLEIIGKKGSKSLVPSAKK